MAAGKDFIHSGKREGVHDFQRAPAGAQGSGGRTFIHEVSCQEQSVRGAPVADRLHERFPELPAQKFPDSRLPEWIAMVLQTENQILFKVVSRQFRVFFFQARIAGNPETFFAWGFTVPDIEKRGFIAEDPFDQSAEKFSELFRIFFMRGPEKGAHRFRIEHIRTIWIFPFADRVCPVLFQNLKIVQGIIRIFLHDFSVALSAGPVEFIVEPERGEAESFAFLKKNAAGVEPFFTEIFQLAAGTGIEQILSDADFFQGGESFRDHFSIGFPRERPHRDQGIFFVCMHDCFPLQK